VASKTIKIVCDEKGFNGDVIGMALGNMLDDFIQKNTEKTKESIGKSMVQSYNSMRGSVEQATLINEERKAGEPGLLKQNIHTTASYTVDGNNIIMTVEAANAMDAMTLKSQVLGTGEAPNQLVLNKFGVAPTKTTTGLSKWYMEPNNAMFKIKQAIGNKFGIFVRK